jgi:hypothetical protein
VDPFTGGGRYVPGSGGENMHMKSFLQLLKL